MYDAACTLSANRLAPTICGRRTEVVLAERREGVLGYVGLAVEVVWTSESGTPVIDGPTCVYLPLEILLKLGRPEYTKRSTPAALAASTRRLPSLTSFSSASASVRRVARRRTVEMRPEVGDSEHDVGALEYLVDGGAVLDVRRDHLDALLAQLLGRRLAGIARDPADAIRLAGLGQGLDDRAALCGSAQRTEPQRTWFPVAPTTVTRGASLEVTIVMARC